MRISFFFFCFIISTIGYSQVQEKLNYSYQQANYDLVILQVEPDLLKQARILSNCHLSAESLLDSLNRTGNSFLAFNAAPTDASGNLLGLFIKSGQLRQPLNTGTGNGNFFLKPNGFWGVEKNMFTIRSADLFSNSSSYQQAVQSGPMLLIDGKINTVFDQKSANRNIRLGIGTFSKNSTTYVLVVRSQTPVSFYDFASLFKDKFNCLNALYLDGGDRSMLITPSQTLRGATGSMVSQILLFKIL